MRSGGRVTTVRIPVLDWLNGILLGVPLIFSPQDLKPQNLLLTVDGPDAVLKVCALALEEGGLIANAVSGCLLHWLTVMLSALPVFPSCSDR